MGPLLAPVLGKCNCHMHCVWGCVWGCVCSLDNFLLKNVIVFLYGKRNFKMVLI